jgi:hypothetical protein
MKAGVILLMTFATGAGGTASPPPPPSPSPPPHAPPRYPPGELAGRTPVKYGKEVKITNQPDVGAASSSAVPARFESPEFIGAMCAGSVALCVALIVGYQALLLYYGKPSAFDRFMTDPRIAPHASPTRRELWLAEQQLKEARALAGPASEPEPAQRLSPEAQAALLRYMAEMLRDRELPPPPTGPEAESDVQLSAQQAPGEAGKIEHGR